MSVVTDTMSPQHPFYAPFHTVPHRWQSKPDNVIAIPQNRLSELVASITFTLTFSPVKDIEELHFH